MRFLSRILRAGRSLYPPTVSWAVRRVLTLDHLPVSPMSNANHTGLQCSANPAISRLLSHSFSSPRRLHCGRKHRDTKKSSPMCYNCNYNSSSVTSPLPYITTSNFPMNASTRQRLWITASCDYTAGLLNSRVTGGFIWADVRCGDAATRLFDCALWFPRRAFQVDCDTCVWAALSHRFNLLSRVMTVQPAVMNRCQRASLQSALCADSAAIHRVHAYP